MQSQILTVTLNPSVDHVLTVKELVLNETNRVSSVARNPGGKGVNLSRFANGLGAKTLATGFLGGGAGAYVRQVLNREGIPQRFIEIGDETRVDFCIDDQSGKPPTTLNEPGPNITEAELSALFDLVGMLSRRATWVAIGGSVPPSVPVLAVAELINIGRKNGARIALDADGEALRVGLQAGPDFVKPNTPEASRLLGRPIVSHEDACAAAREIELMLMEIRGLSAPMPYVALSRGATGALLAHDRRLYSGTSPKVHARSTVGSGDSMIAAMLWSIEKDRTLDKTLRWGLAAGAATAEAEGGALGRLGTALALLDSASVTEERELAVV